VAPREPVRLLFNFLASAVMLVDVRRRLFRGSEWEDAYQTEVDTRLKGDPVVAFVHGLRNRATHYLVPLVTISFRWTEDRTRQEVHYFLHKSMLLEWTNWDPLAKIFLRDAGEEIDLLAVTAQYYAKISALNDWAEERLGARATDDLLSSNPRETLRWLRGELGLSQAALAAALAVTPGSVAAWETHRRSIPHRHRVRIAALLAPRLITAAGHAFVQSLVEE
jgi:DNA-binding transcriptional regulator YiaG